MSRSMSARWAPRLIEDWRPEDTAFWETTGRAIARRNLWLSIPSLLLSFAVWMVWSVVVAKLPCGRLPVHDRPVVLARGRCPGFPARRCASFIPSWCRSSAAGCGPR